MRDLVMINITYDQLMKQQGKIANTKTYDQQVTDMKPGTQAGSILPGLLG